MKKDWKSSQELLHYLNKTYAEIHARYEKFFWLSAMGDHSVDAQKNAALQKRDEFRTSTTLASEIAAHYARAKGDIKARLGYWKHFFSLYQIPETAQAIKKEIDELQTKIESDRATRREGYRDPKTKKFLAASSNKMRSLMVTDDSEAVRRACFDATQKLPLQGLPDYVRLVGLRNTYARALGYEDFYAFKLAVEEGMTKQELFALFDTIYDKTRYAFADIRAVEKEKMPGLRKPWNYSYMLSGSFQKEEDPYFPFELALERWGKSYAALGIDFKKGTLVLDLLDRAAKYNNGFCHWPTNVYYRGKMRVPAQAQFTCTVVLGIPGEAAQGYHTLFHEGGHAAHLLNADMKDICVTTEYPPLSTAWAETQSMFLDTVLSSIEWKMRYAKTIDGKTYPFEIFEKKVRKLGFVRPHGTVHSVAMVCEFEKRVYEEKNLTTQKVLAIAKKIYKKYTDFSVDSIRLLEIPHIYSWESACSYHGYGLATLALMQWRAYFRKKYGYIVDNGAIGKEMERVWKYGGSKTFPELVKIATGKKLSADAYIKGVTATNKSVIANAKKHIAKLEAIKPYTKRISLNATIRMVDGKKIIADNRNSFEAMAAKYSKWLQTKYEHDK